MIVPPGASRIYQETPLVAEYKGFLGKKQCKSILNLRQQLNFTQGQVRTHGQRQVDLTKRRAFTHKITAQDDASLAQLNQKIVDWLGLPSDQWIENSLLIHYPPGGEFKLHTDVVATTSAQGVTTNRIATVIVYLNDDFNGGHTVFPNLKVSVKPAVGKALLFLYNYEGPYLNHLTVHSGEKVNNDKYILVFFIRDNEYPDELRAISHY
jgi:prolyl 4-hydroxylase